MVVMVMIGASGVGGGVGSGSRGSWWLWWGDGIVGASGNSNGDGQNVVWLVRRVAGN